MTILEALVRLRDDIKTWCINNFNSIQTQLDGKAASSHNQAANTITAGTFSGEVKANANSVKTIATAQTRNISAGTTDLTAGSSPLNTGDIYFVYE